MSTTTSLEQAQQYAESVRASLMLAHGNATSVESLLLYPLIAQAADLDIKIKTLMQARIADQGVEGMNNTTRRHPRTLQEAFGPYCSRHIATDADIRERRWHIAMYVLVVLFSVLAAAGILRA